MKAKKKTVLRDSGDGRFISKRTAARKNPKTWEKQRVNRKRP